MREDVWKTGDANSIFQQLASSVKPARGDAAYWQERGFELMKALLSVLVWLRDNRGMDLSLDTVRRSLSLKNLIHLARDESIPMTDENGREVRKQLIAYLQKLSEEWYTYPERKDGNAQKTLRDFSYDVQQWSFIFQE